MNKKFKKILVVLLSALMVLTYMPATALTAFAVEEARGEVSVILPETIPAQEWTGDDLDLSEVDELATITADVKAPAASSWSYGVELERGTDYTVASSTNQKGLARVEFTGMGDYEDYDFYSDVWFWIVETPEEGTYTVDLDDSKVFYDGTKADKAEAEKFVEDALAAGTKHAIIRNGNTKIRHGYSFDAEADSADAKGLAGETYKVDVKLGEKVIAEDYPVAIAKRDLSNSYLKVPFEEEGYEYNGKEQKPAVVGSAQFENFYGELVDIPAADYTLSYSNNVNVSDEAVATLTAKETSDNFTGAEDAYFEIYPFRLSPERVHLMDIDEKPTHEYDGKEFRPELTVTGYFYNLDGGKIPAADYKVIHRRRSVDARVYKVGIVASGNGNLTGVIRPRDGVEAYEITPADLSKTVITPKKGVPQGEDLNSIDKVLKFFDVTVNGVDISKYANRADELEVAAESNPLPNKEYKFSIKASDNAVNFKGEFKDYKYTTVIRPFAAAYQSTYHVTFNGEAQMPNKDMLTADPLTKKDAEDEGLDTITAAQFDIVDAALIPFENNIHAGTAVANIQGRDPYTGQTSQIEFTIDQVKINDGEWPENWNTPNWPNPGWATSQTRTRTKTRTVWAVESISTVANGTYCTGSILDCATVTLRQRQYIQSETQTRTRPNWQSQNWTTGQWSEPPVETGGDWLGEDTRVTLKATDFDFLMTATGFEPGPNENQSYLTQVTVEVLNETGNYLRDGENNAPLTFDIESGTVIANKVNLDRAVVDGTIPATLAKEDITEDIIKKNITVSVDGVALSDEAYKITDINADNAGKVGKTITFLLDKNGDDPQIIGNARPEVEVEAVDLGEFQEEIQAQVDTWTSNGLLPPSPVFTYDGTAQELKDEESSYAGKLAISNDPDTGYPYVTDDLSEGADKDYTLSYDNNINATNDESKATVTFTGTGKFKGTATATFEIAQADLADLGVTPDIALAGVESVQYIPGGALDDLSAKLTLKAINDTKYVFEDSDYTVEIVEDQDGNYDYDDDPDIPANYVEYTVTATENSNNYVAGSWTVLSAYPIVRKQQKRSNTEITLEKSVFTVRDLERDDEETDAEYARRLARLAGPTVKVTDVDPEVTLTGGQDYRLSLDGFDGKVAGEEGYKDPSLEFTFVGNYAGIIRLPITVVADLEDFENIKLEPRSKSGLVYSGREKYIKFHYVGKDDRNMPPLDTFDVVYTDEEGVESLIPPTNVGKYTATIKATEAYGGQYYDSIDFEITQKKMSKFEFDWITQRRLGLADVEYMADYTEDPQILLGHYEDDEFVPDEDDDDNWIVSDEFEVLESNKTEWDGDIKSEGMATIALKADSNFKYDGTAELPFGWYWGNLDNENPGLYYEIPDQEYTGEKLEPTTILTKEGWDLDPEWVEIKYYEGNDQIAGKTAKAYVVVTLPEDSKYVDEELKGFITFKIIEHEETPEEAREHAEEAVEDADDILDDDDYPEAAKELVEAAKAALEQVLENPLATPEEIEDAISDLYDAIYQAEEIKEEYEKAKEEKQAAIDECEETLAKAAAMILMSDDYTDDSIEAISSAFKYLADVMADETKTASDVKVAKTLLDLAIDAAQPKEAVSISVLDKLDAVYNGKTPELPTPIIVGQTTGAVTYKYYSDAEATKELAAAPVNAGTYYYKGFVAGDAKYKAAESAVAAKLTISKATQKVKKVKPLKKTVKSTKKTSFKLKATVTGDPDAKVSFKKTKGDKKIKVNKKGKVTVKKGLKKGKTYSVKVKVSVAKTANYKAASKTVTLKIKVKK